MHIVFAISESSFKVSHKITKRDGPNVRRVDRLQLCGMKAIIRKQIASPNEFFLAGWVIEKAILLKLCTKCFGKIQKETKTGKWGKLLSFYCL